MTEFDIERSAKTLLGVLTKFFHIRFALIAFFNFLWTKLSLVNSPVSSTNIVIAPRVRARRSNDASNLRRRVSRCKGEMIKVHKNAPPNREAGTAGVENYAVILHWILWRSIARLKKQTAVEARTRSPAFLRRRLSFPLPLLHEGKT